MARTYNILALETSTERLSVALSIDGCVYAEQFADATPHSERILVTVQALLAAAGAKVDALEAVAFGAGPGAFTGVRLGCGIAQGISLACAIPTVAVNSLQALAQRCVNDEGGGARTIYTATDARLQEVYYASWSVIDADWREVVPSALARPEHVIVPDEGAWVGCGSGFAVYRDALSARLGVRLAGVAATRHPDASAVLQLAQGALARGEGVAPEHALPIYLRDKVALTSAERAAKALAR